MQVDDETTEGGTQKSADFAVLKQLRPKSRLLRAEVAGALSGWSEDWSWSEVGERIRRIM